MPLEKTCSICGRVFRVPPSKGRVKCCSRVCWVKNDEWRKHISESKKGKKQGLEQKRNATLARTKYHWTYEELYKLYWEKERTEAEIAKEQRVGIGTIHRHLIQLGIPRRSNLAPKNRSPNGLETLLINLIMRKGLPYKFVGNGTHMIGLRNPDFIHNEGQKKVIELFGNYWHSPLMNPKVRFSARKDMTVKAYERKGYECLVIWEDELKNLDRLEKKIGEFNAC